MSTFGFTDLENLWVQAGGSQQEAGTAAAIALAESGGNPNALCDSCSGVPEYSVGLWQINLNAHPQWNSTDMRDPFKNAQAAVSLQKARGNFTDWTTYIDGTFLRYVPGGSAGFDSSGNVKTTSSSTTANSSTTKKNGCVTFQTTLPFGIQVCWDAPLGILAMLGGGVLVLGGVAILVAVALRDTAAGKQATKLGGVFVEPVQGFAQRRAESRARSVREAESARQSAIRTQIDRARVRRERAYARTAEAKARAAKPPRPRVVNEDAA